MFRTSRGSRRQEPAGSMNPAASQQPPPGSPGGYPTPAPPWGPPSQAGGRGAGRQVSETAPAPTEGGSGGGGGAGAGGAGTGGGAGGGTGVEKKPRVTLTGSVYAGIALILIILVVVLDFILQNLDQAQIHLFTAEFRLPIGIMILLGAIGGAVIVLLISLFLHFRDLHRTRQREAQLRQGR